MPYMMDDLVNELSSQRVRRETALADCTFSNQSKKMAQQVVGSASQPTSIGVHGQTDGIFKTAICTMQIPQIDVTDRKWHTLMFGAEVVRTKDGMVEMIANNIGTINLGMLMGIPPQQVTEAAHLYIPTFSGDEVRNYNFFKFKGFTFSWRNFAITVERDTSGGIQMLDDIVFQVRKRYQNLGYGNNASDIEEPMTVNLTDLNKGMQITLPLTQKGWIFHGELLYSLKGEDMKNYISYYEVAHLLDAEGNFGEASVWADFPLYNLEIRAMNLPVGVSNIKVYLNAVCEWKTEMYCLGKGYLSTLILPREGDQGTAKGNTLTQKEFVNGRKRKLDDKGH